MAFEVRVAASAFRNKTSDDHRSSLFYVVLSVLIKTNEFI